MTRRVEPLGRFVLGTALDAALLGAIVTGWYLWPDDPTSQEGLAFILSSLLGLGVLTASWGCWEGLRGLRVRWSLLRWGLACAAATIGVQVVAAAEGVVDRGSPADAAAEGLLTFGTLLVLVLPGAVGGTAVGGAIRQGRSAPASCVSNQDPC